MNEKVISWIIFVVCLFISVICFTNSGLLWSVNTSTADEIELSAEYLDFVRIMNLIFGVIFFVLTIVFLIRALSTYNISWARKLYEKTFSNIDRSFRNMLDDYRKKGEAIRSSQKSMEDEDMYLSDNLGKFTKVSETCDKQVSIPQFSDNPVVQTRITLGDFSYVPGVDLKNTKITSPRPLDTLKQYYEAQKKARSTT